MMEGRLECKELTKKYGKKEVLRHINLELEKGKIYGLIGRNGAGKTTLLSILSAQNPASEGEILLDGNPVWENKEALKHIYFAREINSAASSAISGFKVKEYLKIASEYLPNWDEELAEKLIKLFHLERKKRIAKLSKGMSSMLTIVVALASKAEFTFLDEPVAGLDVVAREQFYQILLDEFTESGRTFVISTHIIEEAEDLFEEVIFLHKGEILLKENTQELLEHTAYISGKAEDVEKFIKKRQVYGLEEIGRSKGAMIRWKENEELKETEDVTVQKMHLQKIFISLCGREDDAE